jgi:hypothetical protein
MSVQKYDSLIIELTSYIQKFKELNDIQKNAEFDLRWRLTQLFKEVKEEDEQKFIDISGMSGHLITSVEKKELAKRKKELTQNDPSNKKSMDSSTHENKKSLVKPWAKSLYRRAVRRCHPDTIKVADYEYKQTLTELYKGITESYENNNLDILMIETYKLFIKPEKVIRDQLEILEVSKNSYHTKIKSILTSQGYVWSTFDDKTKETYLINLMKQQGVRFVDKHKVKEVLKRKISNRKTGQKPKNMLRERVKNKLS